MMFNNYKSTGFTSTSTCVAAFIVLVMIFLFLDQNELTTIAPATRIPWTTSHVHGSPEPPPPFETRRVFPKLTFQFPVDIAFMPGSNRIVIAQQRGTLFSFPNDPNVDHADIFLDPSELQNLEKIPGCKGMGETLAVTFHPNFQQNRYCYVKYCLDYKKRAPNHENGSRVSRFTVTNTDPPRIDAKSEVIVLEWLEGGHNGCSLKFGPDGFLYITTGDAGTPVPPDPFNTGQDISDLLSSVLRIDVDHPGPNNKAYSIPADNPFVAFPGARPEVYAYGLRNPFRMNFDSKTGNLWLGDVGWELWEMIYCVKPGGNYGWSIMEGPNPVFPNGKRGPTEISKPQAALFHTESASITGGLVYRGTKFPEMYGHYIFGDWQTSKMWAAKCSGPKEDALEPHREIAQTDQRIVAFCEDPDHEPIIVDHGGGGLYRLERNPAAGRTVEFPLKLSETGLFASLSDQRPAAGVVPFSINAEQWLDGATAQRFVATPGNTRVQWGFDIFGSDKRIVWPKDSVLVRTLSLEMTVGNPSTKKHVETQLLHFDGRQWQGYSYAWNDAQSDAELVSATGSEKAFDIVDSSTPEGIRHQSWRFQSRTQCLTCHNIWSNYTLAFNEPQLDRINGMRQQAGTPIPINQARTFKESGLLLDTIPQKSTEQLTLTNPYDNSADLNERARSYLHVNCSHCHRWGGGGTAQFDVRKELNAEALKAINVRAVLGDFGLDDAKLICAGDPNRSVIMYRTSKLGRGRMPQIGSERVDEKGTHLLRQWIASLKSEAKEPTATDTSRSHQKDLQTIKLETVTTGAQNEALERLLGNPSGALTLLGDIQSNRLSETARKIALEKAIVSPNENVRDLFRRFDPRERSIVRLGTTIDRSKITAMPGNAVKGRAVFESATSAASSGGTVGLCSSCHRINGQGNDFGPDLSHIAAKYTKAQLLENILEPSKTIADGFATYMLKKKDSERISGFLVSRSDREIVLRDPQKIHHIPTAEVEKLIPQTVSAMPEGLLSNLTEQEAADLLEYLSTLK